MEEYTSVNKDYKEAFNQGYELSKELGLKPEILKSISAGNNRIQAMKEGMEQFQMDNAIDQSKHPIKNHKESMDIDQMDNSYIDLNSSHDAIPKDKDLDLDI